MLEYSPSNSLLLYDAWKSSTTWRNKERNRLWESVTLPSESVCSSIKERSNLTKVILPPEPSHHDISNLQHTHTINHCMCSEWHEIQPQLFGANNIYTLHICVLVLSGQVFVIEIYHKNSDISKAQLVINICDVKSISLNK